MISFCCLKLQNTYCASLWKCFMCWSVRCSWMNATTRLYFHMILQKNMIVTIATSTSNGLGSFICQIRSKILRLWFKSTAEQWSLGYKTKSCATWNFFEPVIKVSIYPSHLNTSSEQVDAYSGWVASVLTQNQMTIVI